MAKDISAEDLELPGELGVEAEPVQTRGRSAREQRIIAGFEEIERYVEENGRLPEHGENRDIFERLYAVRLDRLRASEECREVLKDFDSRGLLKEEHESADSLHDAPGTDRKSPGTSTRAENPRRRLRSKTGGFAAESTFDKSKSRSVRFPCRRSRSMRASNRKMSALTTTSSPKSIHLLNEVTPIPKVSGAEDSEHRAGKSVTARPGLSARRQRRLLRRQAATRRGRTSFSICPPFSLATLLRS